MTAAPEPAENEVPRPPDLTRFAHAWAKVLDGTPHVPMTDADQLHLLSGLGGRLAAALLATPPARFDPMVGYWAATDLVAAGFDAPEALSRTLAVLDTELPAAMGPAGTGVRSRLTRMAQGFATGFARALRDRTLDAQDEIRIAALTARAHADQRLRDAALHDPLTGLPNQAMLLGRLRQLCNSRAAADRLGVCHIGLDGLDAVKTSLGPHVGDQLLHAAAGRLRGWAAEAGHLVARWGDDQFAVLAETTSCLDDAVKVAAQVLALLDDPYRIGGVDLPVRATAGIIERPAAGADPAEVMRAADLARHWARADGATRWMVFDPLRSRREVERYRLSAAMPTALRNGEFTPYYQPLVELRTGRVVGFEALARWQHPTLGLLRPERFIGLAEHTGMIGRLGIHLLEQACTHAAAWAARAADQPYVSVNLAVGQLRHPGLAAQLADILDRTGLPPNRLQLEITETALIDPDKDHDGQTIMTTLRAIAGLGARIVIDDFGTGYSNLSYLPRLPLHGLKLAGTFLTGPAAASDEFLTRLVSLGHCLGMTVTGEGVETPDHVRRLAAAGCDLGQGWHLGLPASISEAGRLLETAALRGP